jgi:pyruvate/2-oxoacid:ferredoxin oxidoreductase alpha subunit
LLVGFGIVSRVLRSAVEQARKQGWKVGLFRPITLWPYPSKELASIVAGAESVLVVELSNGQMLEDVQLAVGSNKPVAFYGRVGGNVPSVEEILEQIEKQMSVRV